LTLLQINTKNTPTALDRDLKNPLFTKHKAGCPFCITDKFTFNFEHVHKSWRIHFDFCVFLNNDIFLNRGQSHWNSSGSRIDHVVYGLGGASVLLNERPQQKNNNQEENLFH